MNLQDKAYPIILMPSSFSPIGNLTSIANDIGGKFISIDVVDIPPLDPKIYDNPIKVYKIPGEQGNPYESACSAGEHVEMTSDQLKQIHLIQIQELNQTITSLLDSAFKDMNSRNTIQGYIDGAVTANNDNDPWKAVYYLGLLKTASDGAQGGNPSDDLIITSEAQGKIYPVIQENIDKFSVEGTTTNTTQNPEIVLTATRTNNDADLSWNEKEGYFGPTVTGYKIERNIGSGFMPIQTSVSDKSYTDSRLEQGSYIYRVSPINSFGKIGNPSNEATVIIPPPGWPPILNAILVASIMIGIIMVAIHYEIKYENEKARKRMTR
jgi:hypothetical protein